MAQIEQSGGDDKKKGAQKKKHIHVDFTPMVDMNMLLITFFMLCTTMLHSKTLSIQLPAPPDPDKPQQEQNLEEVNAKDAVTLIIDAELDSNGRVMTDENGDIENIYYYFGFDPEIVDGVIKVKNEDTGELEDQPDHVKVQRFLGNTMDNGEVAYNGIRNVLYDRNRVIMEKIDSLKAEVLAGRIDQDKFNEQAKAIRDENKKIAPKVTIKASNDAAWQSMVSALDEMQINNISQFRISVFTPQDSLILATVKAKNGK